MRLSCRVEHEEKRDRRACPHKFGLHFHLGPKILARCRRLEVR